VRITLDFDEELVARATAEARRRGLSLAELVELALGSQVDPIVPFRGIARAICLHFRSFEVAARLVSTSPIAIRSSCRSDLRRVCQSQHGP
jgi:hypothetical protein